MYLRVFLVIAIFNGMFLFQSCKDKKNLSAFDEILTQPPYNTISDSLKKDPNNDEMLYRRAVLLNKNNLPEPALADFTKAWLLKKDERYAFGISRLLLDKKPDSAIVFLNAALKELPNSFLLQLSLARGYDALEKTNEALMICNAILDNNPEKVDILKMKAELLSKKNKAAEAILVLEKAYALTPYDIDLNYALAFQYAETKNNKILSLCDSLIQKDSLNNHPEPYYYKGIYFSNINNKSQAMDMFNQAIQHDYNYLNAYIEKGRILYEQKKYSDALKSFQLANTISATFPDAYFWIGKCLQAMGQKDEAKLNYQRAYGLDKTFTAAKEAADQIIN